MFSLLALLVQKYTLTTRFASTKVKILTPEERRHAAEVVQESAGLEVLTLLALLVQKYLLS